MKAEPHLDYKRVYSHSLDNASLPLTHLMVNVNIHIRKLDLDFEVNPVVTCWLDGLSYKTSTRVSVVV